MDATPTIELDKDALLPCPFCGLALERHERRGFPIYEHPVENDDYSCPLVTFKLVLGTPNAAAEVAAWNRRALPRAATPAPGGVPAGTVAVPVTQLVAIRDALAAEDINEAYHVLYSLASPHFDKFEPWAEWERRAALSTAAPPAVEPGATKREINDETEVLRRLAEGDEIAFSKDGDNAWFTKGDRAWIGDVVIAMRKKGYLRRYYARDDEWGVDVISDKGRAALTPAPTSARKDTDAS